MPSAGLKDVDHLAAHVDTQWRHGVNAHRIEPYVLAGPCPEPHSARPCRCGPLAPGQPAHPQTFSAGPRADYAVNAAGNWTPVPAATLYLERGIR